MKELELELELARERERERERVGEDAPLALELGLPPPAGVLLGHSEHISCREGEFNWSVGVVRMQSLD